MRSPLTRPPPALLLLPVLAACGSGVLDEPFCSDAVEAPAPSTADLTWWRDVEPITAQKCGRCHDEGGPAGFSLATYSAVLANQDAIHSAVEARRMPPWLASDCCAAYFQDASLTDDEIATITGWIDAGAPEGDPADAPEPREPVGGLSRIDLTLPIPEPYTPAPPPGSTDDLRCFVLDWPETEPRYVTGLAPEPDQRGIVHHLIVSVVAKDGVDAVLALDEADPGPGFDCAGGTGDLPTITPIGGSLQGGDYPRGIGTLIEPGSKIVLQVHYSLAGAPVVVPDQTSVSFRLDDTAVAASAIVIANPMWLVAGGMHVDAGDPDAVFSYQYRPTLLTGGNAVDLQGVTPHMHRHASKMRVVTVRADGSTDCLLDIGDWDFGWEQPYWLNEPHRLDPTDELYIECHFDNSAAGQPDGETPADFAWGDNDQDMCVGFLSFTEAE